MPQNQFQQTTSTVFADEQPAQPQASTVRPDRPQGLLDSLLDVAPREDARPTRSRLDEFLTAKDPLLAICEWTGCANVAELVDRYSPDSLGEDRPARAVAERLVRRLNHDVAAIDQLLNAQLNAIIHHPGFQRLESSWRGLRLLVDRMEEEGEKPAVKIKALDVSWGELTKDFERAIEFDRSQLFRKVYENEFGTPGGEPFGVLLGDYEIQPRPSDAQTLRAISEVAAAAFCPFVAAPHPAMFGLDQFDYLEREINLAATFETPAYAAWRSIRDQDDSRFIGLALPRVLIRAPYGPDLERTDGFAFREDVAGRDASKYLWGNAAFALGSVLIRSFAQTRWFVDTRGVRRDEDGGGLVIDLPVVSFDTDKPGVAVKCPTDVVVTDQREKQLRDLGFISLCHCADTPYSAFYSLRSFQKPKIYDRAKATQNANMSSMLHYIFCVSRFAHYIKVIGRDRVGSFPEAAELETYLHRWVTDYVTDADSSAKVKARMPLSDASIQVLENPGKPGTYQCVFHLSPHYEFDEIVASIRLATEISAGQGA